MPSNNTTCTNVGDGLGLFANGFNGNLQFKSLIGGPGILLNSNDSSITIEYVGYGKGGAIPFCKIAEAPTTVEPFGLLYGTPTKQLDFVAPPAAPGSVLTFNGIGLVWLSGATGSVRSVAVQGSARLSVVGNTITDTGSFQLDLTPTGIEEGIYTNPTLKLDKYGRVLAATSQTLGEANTISSLGSGASLVVGKSEQDLQLRGLKGSGDVSISANGNDIIISSTAVKSISLTGSSDIGVEGQTITCSGEYKLSLSDTAVVAGTYTAATIMVDEKGRIIAAMSNEAGETNSVRTIGYGTSVFAKKDGTQFLFKSIVTSGGLSISSTDETIALAVDQGVTRVSLEAGPGVELTGGPIVDSGSYRVALAQTGVVAGTYTNPVVAVDDLGRVTSISDGEVIVPTSILSSDDIAAVTGGSAVKLALVPTTVTAGHYGFASFTVDASGRLTTVRDGSDRIENLENKITQLATNQEASELPDTGVEEGTYSNPTVTVDAKGRITAITSVTRQSVSVDLSETGVAPGQYDCPSIVIDATGRITSASSTTASTVPSGGVPGDVLTQTGSKPAWAALPQKIVPADYPACPSWRIAVTGLDGEATGLMAVQEIVFRSEVGGSPITVPGEIASDDAGWGSNAPQNAFDGTAATYVATTYFAPSGEACIGLNYQSAVVVRDLSITATTLSGFNAPSSFAVQYLYNNQWMTAWSISTTTSWAAGETRSFPSTFGQTDEAFRTLADTPSSYRGSGLCGLRVNQAETGIEFAPILKSFGATKDRPTDVDIGWSFFDQTLAKPVWWTGQSWVDASGASV